MKNNEAKKRHANDAVSILAWHFNNDVFDVDLMLSEKLILITIFILHILQL